MTLPARTAARRAGLRARLFHLTFDHRASREEPALQLLDPTATLLRLGVDDLAGMVVRRPVAIDRLVQLAGPPAVVGRKFTRPRQFVGIRSCPLECPFRLVVPMPSVADRVSRTHAEWSGFRDSHCRKLP